MKSFCDDKGRKWDIAITIGDVKRVKDLLDVNLLEPEQGETPLLTRIGTDEILLCDIIYCLIKPQADNANITDIEFGQSLGGKAILDAQTAFYDELVNFFQSRGKTDKAKAIRLQQKMIAEAINLLDLKVQAMEGKEKQIVEKLMSGNTSMNLPDLSELTQKD